MRIAFEEGEPIKVAIHPTKALTLCGLLQIALRHPSVLPESSAEFAGRSLLKILRESLTELDSYAEEFIQQGDNPDDDLFILNSVHIKDID